MRVTHVFERQETMLGRRRGVRNNRRVRFPGFWSNCFFLLGNASRVLILEATQMSGAAFTQEWRTGHTLFRDVIEVNYLTTEKLWTANKTSSDNKCSSPACIFLPLLRETERGLDFGQKTNPLPTHPCRKRTNAFVEREFQDLIL